MTLVDLVAELLADGDWHSIPSMARELDQPQWKIRKIVDFFARFDLVALRSSVAEAKITEGFKQLLASEEGQDVLLAH